MSGKKHTGILAVLVLAMALALAGCNVRGVSMSGQDTDSLTVVPAADTVFEAAENGRIYHYELATETQIAGQYREAVVSPQQAVNFAGTLFEDVYGLNQTDKSITLYYTEKEFENGVVQPRWCAVSTRELYDAYRTNKTSYGVCVLAADTGELLLCAYFPDEQEMQASVSEDFLDFFTPHDDAAPEIDMGSKEFEFYLSQELFRIERFLYQAKLYERATILSVEPVTGEDGVARLGEYRVTYNDGTQAQVEIAQQAWYGRENDWGEYPAKEFLYYMPDIDPKNDLPEEVRNGSSPAAEVFGGES